jgi:hypothetical protein
MADVQIDGVEFSIHRTPWRNTDAGVQQVAETMAGMLQQLPQLSVLKLPGFPMSRAAMQQTDAMHGLQYFSLTNFFMEGAGCDLQYLPSSATKIKLRGYSLQSEVQLPRLLHLQLCYCALVPKVLGGCTQLQTLHMQNCTLLPEDSGQGTAAFLEVLPQLARLQDLKLETQCLDSDDVAPQQYSALTASSQLIRLDLMHAEDGVALPKGVVQHMFSPGRQLQSLQQLTISTQDTEDTDPEDWCIDSADISSIMSGCP